MNLTLECRMVANYIIEKTNMYNEGKPLREQILMSSKRLQKLLYFFDIEYMKEHNGYSFFTDEFYAWSSGPVIPEVYREYMQYQDGKMNPNYRGIQISLTDEVKSIIDFVLDTTIEIDTVGLIKICNVTNGPWYQAYNEEDDEHKQVISKDEMYQFYLENELFIVDDGGLTFENLINDIKFKTKCREYGLDWENAEIYGDAIIVEAPKGYVYVILDKSYNIIGVHRVESDTMYLTKEEVAKRCYELYNSVGKEPGCSFCYPFQNFSLKQILEFSNRIEIDEINHGHSIRIKLDGKVIDEMNNEGYIGLLACIKFIEII